MPVTRDIAANRQAILWTSAENADILLTPAGSLSGYTHEFDVAETRDALKRVSAGRAGAGYRLRRRVGWKDLQSIQLRFYTADGTYLGFHSKTLPTGSLSAEAVGEVKRYAIRPLRCFQFADQPIAGLICNHLWANPTCTPMPDTHLSHRLAELGARIIFDAVNGGRGRAEWSDVNWQFHSSNLRMRARASGIWIVTVDSCEPVDIRCSAPSGALDPNGDWRCQTRDTGPDRFVYTIPA